MMGENSVSFSALAALRRSSQFGRRPCPSLDQLAAEGGSEYLNMKSSERLASTKNDPGICTHHERIGPLVSSDRRQSSVLLINEEHRAGQPATPKSGKARSFTVSRGFAKPVQRESRARVFPSSPREQVPLFHISSGHNALEGMTVATVHAPSQSLG